jgi:hypothetical protein
VPDASLAHASFRRNATRSARACAGFGANPTRLNGTATLSPVMAAKTAMPASRSNTTYSHSVLFSDLRRIPATTKIKLAVGAAVVQRVFMSAAAPRKPSRRVSNASLPISLGRLPRLPTGSAVPQMRAD